MKTLKNLKNKKGFSLVECVMAIGLFAIMALILSGYLALCINQRNSNLELSKGFQDQVGSVIEGDIYNLQNESDGTFFIDFFQSDGTRIASLSDGTLNNYYDGNQRFRLYKPEFDYSEYENKLVKKYHLDIATASNWFCSNEFYCSGENSNFDVPLPTLNKVTVEWTLDFTVKNIISNEVYLLKLPSNAGKITITNASYSYVTNGSDNYLRIKNLKDKHVTVIVEIN